MPKKIPDKNLLTIKPIGVSQWREIGHKYGYDEYFSKKPLKQWKEITAKLTRYFVNKHFGKSASYYWVGNDIGGVIDVCDRFFSLSDVVNFVRYKYTSKEMFDYYDMRLENDMLKKPKVIPNIRNWKALKSEKICKT